MIKYTFMAFKKYTIPIIKRVPPEKTHPPLHFFKKIKFNFQKHDFENAILKIQKHKI